MKKIFKVLVIIALVAVIGFSMACGGGDNNNGTAPTITTASLPNGTVGTAYSQTLTATGDTPITWSVDSGTLPTGLSLAATGAISGTPSAAATSTFTVKATNSIGNNTKQLSITITAGSDGGDNPFKGKWEYADETETEIFTLTFEDTLVEMYIVDTFEYINNNGETIEETVYGKQKGTYTHTSNTATITLTESKHKDDYGEWKDDPYWVGPVTVTVTLSNGKLIVPSTEGGDFIFTKTNKG